MQDPRIENPDNWNGIFYVNKNDKRIFLPKRNPKFGYTINFGNIYSYIFIAAVVLFMILMSL